MLYGDLGKTCDNIQFQIELISIRHDGHNRVEHCGKHYKGIYNLGGGGARHWSWTHKPRGTNQGAENTIHLFMMRFTTCFWTSGLDLSPAFGGAIVPQWCNLPPLVYTPWLGHVWTGRRGRARLLASRGSSDVPASAVRCDMVLHRAFRARHL